MANRLIFLYCLEGWYRGTEQATWLRVGLEEFYHKSRALGKAGNVKTGRTKNANSEAARVIRLWEGRGCECRKVLAALDVLRAGSLHSSSYFQEKLELLYTF
jgi:hypothetical protein